MDITQGSLDKALLGKADPISCLHSVHENFGLKKKKKEEFFFFNKQNLQMTSQAFIFMSIT